MNKILLLVLICFSASVVVCAQAPKDTAPLPTLKSVVPFPVGAAISVRGLRNVPIYKNLIIKQYNSITAENAMKMSKVHPSEKVFNWKDADEIVDFAIANNMRIHGHTLIWSSKYPKWVDAFQGDRAAWKNLFKTHIQTVVKHFKGKVKSWDVVNEALTDGGNLKKSVWLEKIGPEYIALAFQYAHEADPDALLFYNDYGQQYGGKKMAAILAMVKDFKKREIPIHGLGLQMHVLVRTSDTKLRNAINASASSGLLIHISELEISVKHNMPETFLLTDELAMQQAEKYKTIFQAFAAIPKRQQFGITTWNVGDKDAFRNSKIKNHDHPMLFDTNYQPKSAFRAIVESMKR